MERTFASAKLSGDIQAKALIDSLSGLERDLSVESGIVYYDFPLFRDSNDDLHRAQVLLASRSHGLQIFAIAPGRSSPDALLGLDNDLSQLESVIFGKCLQSRRLRKSQRELAFPLSGFLVAVDLASGQVPPTENELLKSFGSLPAAIANSKMEEPLSEDAWRELRAIVEGTKAIIRPKPRPIPPAQRDQPTSKVSILAELESEIATFDANQRRAAISLVNGPQRIRGLAGSGKTVVLAMKAAHIHLVDPDADILFTFYTKSLYDSIRRLITRFYRQYNDRDPDWTKIHVRHAWGGRTMEGVYYSACLENGYSPRDYKSVASQDNPFAYICSDLLKQGTLTQAYDYTLMDEAQDFPPSFYQLCFRLTKGGERDRNVIWAYDELQNIINVKVASPKETFGTDPLGVPIMDLDRAAAQSQIGMSHDIVLYKCYRNPREILVCAHALGFGVYSDTMVQTLENKAHWEDLGYAVESGEIRVGGKVVVTRPEENSPLAISHRQTPAEIIETHVADSMGQEADWVVSEIQLFIKEGLNANDILVICLDDRNTRGYFKDISEKLDLLGLRTNNLLADPYSEPHFTIADHVTLSTVYRAKGNEAAVVIAIGIDAITPQSRSQKARNKLFTAFTRAKAWLRVSGINGGAEFLMKEISSAIAKMPSMVFIQPDPKDILTLQRDLSDRASKLRKLQEPLFKELEEMEFDENEKDAFLSGLRKKK